MVTVGQILAGKTTQDVCTISPDSSVLDAITVFAEHNLGALIVTEDGTLQGLITERDYARKVMLLGRSSKTTTVREIMSKKVIFVTETTTIDECMALMINKFIRHLPVLQGHQIVGVISIGDVVKANLGEKEFLIDELVRYITDSPMVMQGQAGRDAPGLFGHAASHESPH